MKGYIVTWEIFINADSPEEAAREALKIQRDSESLATVFGVTDDETNDEFTVDLGNT